MPCLLVLRDALQNTPWNISFTSYSLFKFRSGCHTSRYYACAVHSSHSLLWLDHTWLRSSVRHTWTVAVLCKLLCFQHATPPCFSSFVPVLWCAFLSLSPGPGFNIWTSLYTFSFVNVIKLKGLNLIFMIGLKCSLTNPLIYYELTQYLLWITKMSAIEYILTQFCSITQTHIHTYTDIQCNPQALVYKMSPQIQLTICCKVKYFKSPFITFLSFDAIQFFHQQRLNTWYCSAV